MNAERLHAIANSLKAELTQSETPALMQQLIQNLQQLVQNPAQPGPQQIVSDTRQQLDQRVADAPSNHWSPAWRQAVEELGVADILGEQLRARIATVFERNEITPTAAANELAPIADRLTQLDAALDQLRASFGFFNIGAEELAPGEGEVGFLIPRARVENELGALGEEFTRVKAILAPFLELTTGSRPDVVVRSISSSEFQVLVYAMPVTVLMLAKALDTLISAYQKVIDIRLARQKLKDAGASKETLESASRDAEAKMGEAIDALADELLADVKGLDDGRRNELRKELRDALRRLANRIDRGYVMEVRVGELPARTSEEEEEAADEARLRKVVEEVLSRQERLKFANLTGEPILELPEAVDDTESDAEEGAPRSPRPATRRRPRQQDS